MPAIDNTREELGHSVIGCSRTSGHDCARANPSRGKSHGVISPEKKFTSWQIHVTLFVKFAYNINLI